MPVFVFSSTDVDAPRCSGTIGDGVNLLDKILNVGYNVLTGVTVARVGAVATFTKASHGFVTGQIVRHSGFTEPEYNVDAKITVTSSSTWTIPVAGTPATPGAVAGGAKMCPLDWTIEQTAANQRSYRAPFGLRHILAVDDTSTLAMRVRGFESVTAPGIALTSGSGPFPLDTQLSGGVFWDKSSAASTVARAWKLYSDGKFFIFRTNYNGAATQYSQWWFGEFVSYLSTADAFATYIGGESTISASGGNFRSGVSQAGSASGSLASFIARSYTQTGGGIASMRRHPGRFTNSGNEATMGGASFLLTYPAPIAGGLIMARMIVSDTSGVTTVDDRGYIQGLWMIGHNHPLTDGDTFTGAAGTEIAGKNFVAFDISNGAQIAIQIDDWN